MQGLKRMIWKTGDLDRRSLSFLMALVMVLSCIFVPGVKKAEADSTEKVTYYDRAAPANMTPEVNANSVLPDNGSWPAGTYVARGTKTIPNRITIEEGVKLILGRGAALTMSKGFEIGSSGSLSIYEEMPVSVSGALGKLVVNGEDGKAAIGVSAADGSQTSGKLEIDGGNITVTGGRNGAGIGGNNGGNRGTVMIYGGIVTAKGGTGAAGIVGWQNGSGENITISGGIVNGIAYESMTVNDELFGNGPGITFDSGLTVKSGVELFLAMQKKNFTIKGPLKVEEGGALSISGEFNVSGITEITCEGSTNNKGKIERTLSLDYDHAGYYDADVSPIRVLYGGTLGRLQENELVPVQEIQSDGDKPFYGFYSKKKGKGTRYYDEEGKPDENHNTCDKALLGVSTLYACWEKSSSGSYSGYYSGTLTTTTTNEDGTQTVTSKEPDGTITEKILDASGEVQKITKRSEKTDYTTGEKVTIVEVEYKDGRKEITVTKESTDGTKETSVTKESTDGTKETSVTKESTDGTKETSVTKESADGTKEITTRKENKNGDIVIVQETLDKEGKSVSKVTTETKTDADGAKVTTETTENADGSSIVKKESIAPDGTVTERKTTETITDKETGRLVRTETTERAGEKETVITKELEEGKTEETHTIERPDGSSIVTREVKDGNGKVFEKTSVEIKPAEEPGTKVTTQTSEDADGNTKVTVSKERADGSREITVTKIMANGEKEISETKENADGSREESITKENMDGTTTFEKKLLDKDGNVTETFTKETSVEEGTGAVITTESTERSDGSSEQLQTKEFPDRSKEVIETKKNADGTTTSEKKLLDKDGNMMETFTRETSVEEGTGAAITTESTERSDGSSEQLQTKEFPDGSSSLHSEKTDKEGNKEFFERQENKDGTVQQSSVSKDEQDNVTKMEVYEKTKTGETTLPLEVNGNNTVGIEKIETTEKNLVIPENVQPADGNVYQLTEIKENAAKGNKKLESVGVGKKIRNIRKGAFNGCTKLKKLTGCDGVTEVGESAFYGCALRNVSLPAIRKLGKKSFMNNKQMTKMVIGTRKKKGGMQNADGNTAWGEAIKISIAGSALENCIKLKEVIINSEVTKIGNDAFRKCKALAKIVIYSLVLKVVGERALGGVHDCKINVPKVRLKTYKILFKNKGQGKKVVVAKM